MNLKGTIEAIRQSFKKPLVTAIVGFIIGLIIGLPVLGWGLFPVKWIDAAPAHLREDVKLDVLSMVVESYAYNQDSALALNRWKELGDGAVDVLKKAQALPILKAEDLESFGALVSVPVSSEVVPAGETEAEAPAPAETEESAGEPAEASTSESSSSNEVTVIVSSGGEADAVNEEAPADKEEVVDVEKPASNKVNPLLILGVLALLALVLGAALLYWFVLRKKTVSLGTAAAAASTGKYAEPVQDTVETAPRSMELDSDTPIAQFMTTYVAGDDLYDDSFTIDSPTGEFLGECGVGITETVGVGEPKKVAALEVWLFDKNDIQTVTKVLLSEYSFNDPVVQQRVVSKGEPVMIEQDKVFLLETATLQLEARVVDVAYGQSALPENSYFDRITMDLTIWPKA